MRSQVEDGGQNNGRAVLFMLASAVCYSFIPLVIVWSGGGDEPFLFSAGWRLGVTCGYLVFLFSQYGRLLTDRRVTGLVLRRVASLSILFVVASNFEIVLYAWSTQFIDISVSAVLFELGPILEIILMAVVLRKTGLYRSVGLSTLLMVGICFVGVAFLMGGQHGGFALWEGPARGSLLDLAVGVGLAVLGVGALSLLTFGFKWGFRLSSELRASGVGGFSEGSLALFGVIVAFLIGNLVSIPANSLLGLGLGEGMDWRSFGLSVGGGMVVNALGSVLARVAILQTDDLGLNALGYATPVLALLWLFLFSEVGVARADYLVIGVVAILSVNLLINFQAEIRLGFRSLVLALWAFGTFVYLRDAVIEGLFPGTWMWAGASCFQALALSATLFILILSFRVARLAGRARGEDRQIFALAQRLEVPVYLRIVDDGVLEHLGRVDGARATAGVQRAYLDARTALSRTVREGLGIADLEYLAETEAMLNDLAYSRHRGIEFGELFALMVFGGVTILLSLFSRPPVLGWTGVLVDLLAVLFSAVVCFLMVNVFDLRQDRYARVLGRAPDLGGYMVTFRDSRDRVLEQWLSVAVGLSVAADFGGLFCHKWLS